MNWKATYCLWILMLTAVLLLAGCGDMPNKWLAVKIESTPPGARVTTSLNEDLGTTPTEPKILYRTVRGSLPGLREIKQELIISKEGYEPSRISLSYEEYKYGSREEAGRNPRIIHLALKPLKQ